MTEPTGLSLVVRGSGAAPVIHRVSTEVVRVGRAPECEIVLDDLRLSRVHMELREEDGVWSVVDLGSRNGTFLNGLRIVGAAIVNPGDEIRLGQFTIIVGGRPRSVNDGPTQDATDPPAAALLPASATAVLVGTSEALARVREQIDLIAPLPHTALITGETGTGKELVAAMLHARSPRAMGPMVIVNCPALSPSLVESELFGVEKGVATGVDARPGRLELADGGTLFLDELADLDLPAQAKLLRFLQDKMVERIGGRQARRIDARVIAATNKDLSAAVAEGKFRADLLHRLSQFTLRLPPLRERREDIAPLVTWFLARVGGPSRGITPEALALLEAQDWPGNVRSLEHVVEAARHVARGLEISAADVRAMLVASGLAPEAPEAPSAPARGVVESAADLLSRIEAGEGFWEVLHAPFLRREVSRETAREFVRLAHEKGGRSYLGMARLLRVEPEYKRLMNFLAHHELK